MNNFISQVINGKINTLKLSYNENKSINHQGIKGNVNEILLRELIQSVIPNKYSFTRGVIQDYKGFQSNESDIIIYDSEILPTVLFGGEFGFVPAESVKYNIEVKSTLNRIELESTKNKFKNILKCKGYNGTNTLVAFASDLKSKSELQRYYEIDENNFVKSPLVRVLMIFGRGYYFFNSQKVYLKQLIPKNDFAKLILAQKNESLEINNCTGMSIDSNINIQGNLILNEFNYEDLYVFFNRWYEVETDTLTNECFLGFLSGVSNTLSAEKFGKYLLNDVEMKPKIYSECILDMWGNISCQNIDLRGYTATKLNEIGFSMKLRQEQKMNKMEFFFKS